jgi:hypothetical protein
MAATSAVCELHKNEHKKFIFFYLLVCNLYVVVVVVVIKEALYHKYKTEKKIKYNEPHIERREMNLFSSSSSLYIFFSYIVRAFNYYDNF